MRERALQLFLGKPKAWLLAVLRLSGACGLSFGGSGGLQPGMPTWLPDPGGHGYPERDQDSLEAHFDDAEIGGPD